MTRKKICMLGASAVGKTSLVGRFVSGTFSDRYLTTIGVKIDKRDVSVDGQSASLVLWDLNGEDEFQSVRPSYLRGAAGFFLVVDPTRPATLERAVALRDKAREVAGDVPWLCLLNKADLEGDWEVGDAELAAVEVDPERTLRTSAKTGAGVIAAFEGLAAAMLAQGDGGVTGGGALDFSGLFGSLDVAVFEDRGGELALVGERPQWLDRLAAGAGGWPARSEFLAHFLDDARAVWGGAPSVSGAPAGAPNTEGVSESDPRAESGPWTELDGDGRPCVFEATALCTQGRSLLLVERLGARHEDERRVLQRARETVLDRERLERAERRVQAMLAALERSHADLLAILDRLGVGVALTDAAGCVTFASETARAWLGLGDRDLAGASSTALFEGCAEGAAEVASELERPEPERRAVDVAVAASGASEREPAERYLSVEVRDDPREAGRRMLVLTDRTEERLLRRALDERAHLGELVGRSAAMAAVYELIGDLAPYTTTVLIEGETGTGKELVARALHDRGPRTRGPFVALNCAGLTESLLGSQLFGHKRGAFTGATADHVGLVEAAGGGTLFLDEVGDVPMEVQTRLLRVLQEREIVRLGETAPRKVDVRVIAATHRDLAEEVRTGRFREDLYYRIRVARIPLPPLADRREDVPLLARTFLGTLAAELKKDVRAFEPEALALLTDYPWPGNVRELKSAVELALVRAKGAAIRPGDLPPEVLELSGPDPGPDASSERERLLAALHEAGGNRSRAARLLGVSRATFYRWLTRLEIDPEAAGEG